MKILPIPTCGVLIQAFTITHLHCDRLSVCLPLVHSLPWSQNHTHQTNHETFLLRNSMLSGRMFAEPWLSFDKGWSSPKRVHLSVAGLYFVPFSPTEPQALLLLCLALLWTRWHLMLAVYMCTVKSISPERISQQLMCPFLGLCFRAQELKPKE